MEATEGKKKSFSAQYRDLLLKYPLLVNAVQGAIIAALGVIASQILSGMKQFDFSEVWIMMLINFAYHPPVLMWFNSVLQKSNMKIIPLLFVDQALFSPVFTAGIVSLRLLLLGTDLRAIPAIVMDVVPKAMGPSWMFWVPSKAIIFLYVPPMYQLLAGNAFAFVWTIIFAMILQAK
jgi:protein Mpv17